MKKTKEVVPYSQTKKMQHIAFVDIYVLHSQSWVRFWFADGAFNRLNIQKINDFQFPKLRNIVGIGSVPHHNQDRWGCFPLSNGSNWWAAAVVVAWLVGMHVSDKHDKQDQAETFE